MRRAVCAEFPNDNPALHDGSVWVCLETTGAPVRIAPSITVSIAAPPPEPEPEPALAEDDGPEIEVVDEIEFEVIATESVAPPAAEVVAVEVTAPAESVTPMVENDQPAPEAPDPFAAFVRVVCDVVRDAGGEARVAVARKALGEERVDDAIPEDAAEALVAGGVLERGARGLARTEAFTAIAVAWRAILRGESEDFAACGARMLDEWAADLAARALGAPAKLETLRRELRARGVAAFGMIEAAA